MLKGSTRHFNDHSHALTQAVKLFQAGDSGRVVRTFVVSDTGTTAREYRLRAADTGSPGKEYGADLGKIEAAQAKAYKARGGINEF